MSRKAGSPGILGGSDQPEGSRNSLEPMVVALRQLIEIQDETVVDQSRKLERALDDLRLRADDLDRGRRDLRSILDSMSDGVAVVDEDGRLVEFNPAAARILGSSRQDVPPAEWARQYGLFLPDQKTIFPAERLPLYRAMRGEEVNAERMCVRRRDSAEVTWISVNARPLRDRTSVARGGVAVFRDVTDLAKSERQIRRLSSAVEETDDPVFMTTKNGEIVYINPAFSRVTGYSREEALGKTPRILKSGQHDAAFYKHMWDTIVGGNVFRGATVNRKKSGEVFHAESTITPIKDASGSVTHFVALVKDMTERRAAQAREIEMELAAVVQKKLYPQSPPEMENCDIAGAVFPATELCGDYFDYIRVRYGAMVIAVGDVCGHGLGPALLMAETRAYLRSLAREFTDLGPIFTRINERLVEDLTESYFVALLAVRVDPLRRQVVYCNAGHAAGYILTGAGDVKAVLRSTGVPLGLFGGQEHTCSEEIALDPSDLLVLLTDGVTESGGGDEGFFGEERVLDTVRAHRDESSRAIIQHVHRAARGFGGHRSQQDDMTLVICKFGERPASRR